MNSVKGTHCCASLHSLRYGCQVSSQQPNGDGMCRKPAPVRLDDFAQAVNSLLDRTENIQAVLLALLLGKHKLSLHSGTCCSMRNLQMNFDYSCDNIAGT